MIDIICYYDKYHSVLFNNFFYPTYKQNLYNNFTLVPIKTNSTDDNNIGFESKNWCDIIINRFDALKEYVSNNSSKWAIFSDIDIVFLDNFMIDIEKYFYQNNYDIIYMSEIINNRTNHYINGGFFLFKCCDYIYEYFDNIQTNIKLMDRPNDQIFLHKYLKQYKQNRHSILDDKIFVANNNSCQETLQLLKLNKIKVFHATSTWSLLSKIQVLSSVMCLKSLTENTVNSEKKSRLWI